MTGSSGFQAKLYTALSLQRRTLVKEALAAARQLELPLYLVGGAVRDILMGRAIMDLDLVVEGDAGLLATTLANALAGQIVAHSQFGTARLRVLGQRIDLATARRETYRRPGALPTVHPSSIAEDLERRDFTINAIALRMAPAPLQLLDPQGGQRDIAAGLIRVLYPASFQDDATRVLRAVRYEHRLGFRLERETERLLHRDLGMLGTISGDRLRRELDLLFREEGAAHILVRAAELGALAALYPDLPDAPTLTQRLSRLSLLNGPAQPHHYLAALAYSLGHGQREGLIKRLNMPSTWAKVVRDVVLAREAARSLASEMSPATVCRRLRPFDVEAIQVESVLTSHEGARHNFQRYLQEWRQVRPLLNGRDLMRLGVPPGPQVGALLEALLDTRLEGRVRTRREEETFVRDQLPYPTQ